MYSVAVLTINDRCSGGQKEDKSGKIIQEIIVALPAQVVKYEIIPVEPKLIKEKLAFYADTLKADLILTNGGTGFGPADLTPEVTRELIQREIPGIPEAMRTECLKFTKKAMLSRGIAGVRGKSLIINLPGSSSGAKESLEAIFDGLAHGLDMVIAK